MARTFFLVLVVIIASLAVATAGAQTPPAPSPNPSPPAGQPPTGICSRPAAGGEKIGVTYIDTVLEVTLPAPGAYTHSPIGPVGVDPGIQVCNAATGSAVRISALTGKEIGRTADSAAGHAVLDQIVASARLRRLADVPLVNTVLSPPPGAVEGLRYRLLVYGRDPSRLVADGTRVSISVLPRAREQAGLPPQRAPCAQGIVVAGRVEIVAWLTSECPAGMPVSMSLAIPGEFAITARAEPSLEWRAPRPGEPPVIEAVIRPIPPNSGGIGSQPAISPPITGSAGLLSSNRYGGD
jgi:hypothetical protein